MYLDNINIVLSNTSHPGNIGATARAMKNMALARLVLVNPARFPGDEAAARASGADNILISARICTDLDKALSGCHWVVGATSRERTIGWPTLTPQECARQLIEKAAIAPVALLFGRERCGLTNEEVDRCQALVSIPGNKEYRSLNLASAVQILAYEIYLAHISAAVPAIRADMPLTTSDNADMEQFYRHLEQVLVEIGFLDPDNPRKLMRRLRRLFNRATPDKTELNVLRGILTAIQQTEYWPRHKSTRSEGISRT